MMTLVIACGALVLLVAPVRRWFFGAWRLTVPLSIGLAVGLQVAPRVIPAGLPSWYVVLAVLCATFMIGGAIDHAIRELAGPDRR